MQLCLPILVPGKTMQFMDDQGDEDIHVMTSADIAALPDRCVGPCPDEEEAYHTCMNETTTHLGASAPARTCRPGSRPSASCSACGSAGSRGSPTSSAKSRPWPRRNST